MFGLDASHTHFSPDTAINRANVSTVRQLFVSPGQFGPLAESNGVVYAGATNGNLYAFDANGITDCSGTPNQCSPLWTGSSGPIFAGETPAVSKGVVYVASQATSTSPGELYAFDANGVTNCSGTPKACQPLWTAPTGGTQSSPTVTNGVVYIGAGQVEAFDANGSTKCSGTPKTCAPLWKSASNAGFSSPAVANGDVYVSGQDDELYAYSANGTTNCSGTPTTCNPLWKATMGTTTSTSSPAVSRGVVYDESNDSKMFAFDANGVTNCSGTPTTCSPLWTAALSGTPDNSSPAVANGIVYAPSSTLQAFDASGVTNCSGTPGTCTPLWSYNVTVIGSSPSVADGLVYIGSSSNASPRMFGVMAFDASGRARCSGTPAVCTPLWTGPTGAPLTGSPAVANGKVYANDNSFGLGFATDLYAWVVPPPTAAIILPSNGDTVSGTDQGLDASASGGVTQVQYELTGGTLNHSVIATATLTIYGWTASWNTTTVPNGVYTLQSVASYGGEVSGTSPGITITVANPGLADLANSSFTVTTAVGGSGCGLVHLTFDAVYPGSAALGNVTLHIAGCVSAAPFTYAGSFTITTGVGTLSGSATGPVNVQVIGGMLEQSYQMNLSVTTATGSLAGTTGSFLFSTSSQTSLASLTVE
jgi:PQQ-like domain/Bacterial Ig domain